MPTLARIPSSAAMLHPPWSLECRVFPTLQAPKRVPPPSLGLSLSWPCAEEVHATISFLLQHKNTCLIIGADTKTTALLVGACIVGIKVSFKILIKKRSREATTLRYLLAALLSYGPPGVGEFFFWRSAQFPRPRQ